MEWLSSALLNRSERRLSSGTGPRAMSDERGGDSPQRHRDTEKRKAERILGAEFE